MQFKVQDWMVDLVVFISPEDSVVHALELMRRRYIHSLIVEQTKENPNYGIVTSTDICDKIIAQGKSPSQLTIRDVMTSPVITIPADLSLQDCARKMMENKIHHLPVMNQKGELVGMISDTDFLAAAEAMDKIR